jgi:cytochrome P450
LKALVMTAAPAVKSTRPPGPRDGLFGFATMRALLADILVGYPNLQRDYGDSVSLSIGPTPLFVFFHPDQIREVLVTEAKRIIRHPRTMSIFAQWNGPSVLIVEGEPWIRQRRLIQPAFQPRRYAEYAGLMTRAIDATVAGLASAVRHGPTELNVREVMTTLTLDIACQTFFATDLRDSAARIAQAVATLSRIAYRELTSPFVWPNWVPTRHNREKLAAMRVMDDVVWRIVKARRADGTDHGDLLSRLMAAVDEDGDGGRLTDEQIRNETMTLLLAGHDTTAAALEWFWYLLAEHPHVAARCREELTAVCGDRPVEFADLERLPYLNATIRETLRLYPPAFGVFLRQAAAELQIGGYTVPRGSLIALSSWVTHRDPRWYPDPTRFDPERFHPPRAESIPAGAWFPFGLGPRVCVGQGFAMVEMALVAARLLRAFEFTRVPNDPPPIPEMTAALRPKTPLRLRVEARS